MARRQPAFVAAALLVLACSGGGGAPPVDPGGDPGGGGGGGGGGGSQSGWSSQAEIGAVRNSAVVEIYGVDVDLNEGGTGIAAWEEAGDGFGTVFVAWHAGGAWQSAVPVSTAGTHAILPRVALNDAGQAVVAWEVVDDASGAIDSRTVWASRWVAGAWTAPERLCAEPAGPGDLYAWRPRVGIDAAGHALVTWDQDRVSDALPYAIHASRFDGASWSAPFAVSSGTLYAAWSDVAVSADGSAAVVWVQDTNPWDPNRSGGGPTNPNVWARVFSGAAWSAPQRVGSDLADFEGTERPRVVMDASGRAFAVWEEHRLAANGIAASALDPAGPTWSAPATLAATGSSVVFLSFPSIATDGHGDAFAVWQAGVPDSSLVNGAAARFDGTARSWGPASEFETGGAVDEAVAAMDGGGSGWAIFSGGGLRARRHDASLGWQDAQSLGFGHVEDAEANGAGAVIVGGWNAGYVSSPPSFVVSARGSVYSP